MERNLEQRNDDRIPFKAPVFLNKNGKRLFGEVENISQTGMYVSVTGNHAPGNMQRYLFYFSEASQRSR